MHERFTDRTRLVMALADKEAKHTRKHIDTEHILIALFKEGTGVGAGVLKRLDVDLPTINLKIEKLVKPGTERFTIGKLPQMPRAKNVIAYAIEECRNFGHDHIGTEHMLLGLMREHDGVAAQVLRELGLELEQVREEVLKMLEDTMGGEEWP